MKKILIDTNCLISFVSDRNLEQQEKVVSLFQQSRRSKKLIVCHHHVISEFVYVLTGIYSLQVKTVQQMVADLISIPYVIYSSDVDMPTLFSLWPEKIPDYGDAVLAAYCKKTKGVRIATFDKKFNNALTRAGLAVMQWGRHEISS